MSGPAGVWLEDLTWEEAKALFSAGAVVVIPIGAAAKAHGFHLPLKTDAVTARALGQRLLERLPVVVAPVLGMGYYPAFTTFAGSQHLSVGTFLALLGELLAGLREQGVRRIVLLNTGVSTEAPLETLAADDLLVLHMRQLGRAAESWLDVPAGGHADERETSVMLALEPRSVRMAALVASGPFEQTAATGDPSRASAFKGERILAARVDDIVTRIISRWPDTVATPPGG
ncbi:creatininase family protein [Reyranella sp.]|uniref:creatininase family protein n=1 Tax=Reyranella sp. TaxID=1929291 RepID=UPI003BA9F9E9